jgi:hypothetical protein
MSAFKNIDISSTVIKQNVVSYTHNFTTSSAGIQSINIISGSVSSSYWNSLNVLFYTSGSPQYPKEHKFEKPINNLAISARGATQYLNKFHGYISSSLITIPQQYYGEKIKEKSFTLVGKDFTDNSSNNPKIVDDGNGNLYSTNAHHSQSTNHASHSDNYVGNIFYEQGIAVITETGSWSGSVDYSDITKDSNFTIQLDSYNTMTSHEYSVTLMPNEFNHTMNYSVRMPLSGSFNTLNEFTSSIHKNPYLASEFTESNFTPYITTINLYQKGDIDTPVMTATLPKAIRKSNKISTTFKIRLDM